MTVKELTRSTVERLEPLYGSYEARAMVRLMYYALKDWELTDTIINEDRQASDWLSSRFDGITDRLLHHEPIQYILGKTSFYGMHLDVSPAVLIPRPETEELVDLIVKDHKDRPDLRVLDIGTGSGAIAIALARNLPFSNVTAIDISEEALVIARLNATNLKAHIEFLNKDIFLYSPSSDSFDIIVSNPPYICESEKKNMESNVLDFEPHRALFVPDDDPLLFYSRILDIAAVALAQSGSIYFEINPDHADDLVKLADKKGFRNIRIHTDIHNRKRFLSAIAPKSSIR